MDLQPIPPVKLDDQDSLDALVFAVNERLTKVASTDVGQGQSLSGSLDVVNGLANDQQLGEGVYFEVSTPQVCTLTGFAGGVNNRQAFVKNVGSTNITMAYESGSSGAANRFKTRTGADVTLSANDIVQLIYSGKLSRWIVLTNLL